MDAVGYRVVFVACNVAAVSDEPSVDVDALIHQVHPAVAKYPVDKIF